MGRTFANLLRLNLFIFLPFSENGAHPCAFILNLFFEAYD